MKQPGVQTYLSDYDVELSGRCLDDVFGGRTSAYPCGSSRLLHIRLFAKTPIVVDPVIYEQGNTYQRRNGRYTE